MEDFIAEIEKYCAASGIAETTFGRLAHNDGKFVGRLKGGGTVTLATFAKVKKYMTENPPEREAEVGA